MEVVFFPKLSPDFEVSCLLKSLKSEVVCVYTSQPINLGLGVRFRCYKLKSHLMIGQKSKSKQMAKIITTLYYTNVTIYLDRDQQHHMYYYDYDNNWCNPRFKQANAHTFQRSTFLNRQTPELKGKNFVVHKHFLMYQGKQRTPSVMSFH